MPDGLQRAHEMGNVSFIPFVRNFLSLVHVPVPSIHQVNCNRGSGIVDFSKL